MRAYVNEKWKVMTNAFDCPTEPAGRSPTSGRPLLPGLSGHLHELGCREGVVSEEGGSEVSRRWPALAVAGRVPGHQRELGAGQ